jgi:two-component system cell cycle response regulator DivK
MPPAHQGSVILVVDDVPDGRTMYSLYLTHHGYRVVEAANGVDAIEQAYSHRPDVILMDLGMPHLDGWEAIRRIKTEERTRHIPVLAISGHAFPDAVARATAAGADGFLPKPSPPALVLAKIHELLSGTAPSS